MSPVIASLLNSAFLSILRFIRPSKSRCERLEWIDIPDGLLHECTLPTENCTHVMASTKQSWNATLGTFFTRIRRATYVSKPRQLNFRTDYLRTDSKTLKVMLAIIADPYRHRFWHRSEKDLLRVKFEDVGGILTAVILPSRLLPPEPGESRVYKEALRVT